MNLKAQHDRFLAEHERILSSALEDAEDIVHGLVYLKPGFKPVTGKSQAATKTRIVRTRAGSLLRVTNANKNAIRLELGTQPHWIFPHKKPLLRFKTKSGRWVSKKFVKHPGTRPYLFVRGAVLKANERVADVLTDGMRRAASRRY